MLSIDHHYFLDVRVVQSFKKYTLPNKPGSTRQDYLQTFIIHLFYFGCAKLAIKWQINFVVRFYFMLLKGARTKLRALAGIASFVATRKPAQMVLFILLIEQMVVFTICAFASIAKYNVRQQSQFHL